MFLKLICRLGFHYFILMFDIMFSVGSLWNTANLCGLLLSAQLLPNETRTCLWY